jgi:tetratricopeptide (TPR) repeat protein
LKKITLFLLCCACFFFATSGPAYGLGWKKLHEKADRMSLDNALSAVAKNPDSVDELYVLALVYLNIHKDRQAGDIFQKIISLNPQVIEAKWGRAEVLRRQRRFKESQELLNEVIESVPSFSPAYITLAYIKYMKMDFAKAVRLALTVINQGRENVDLNNYTRAYLIVAGSKGMLASHGGPLAKIFNGMAVLPNLKKAEKLEPDSQAVLFGLGSFYFLAPAIAGGNIEKALYYLERAIQVDPLFADAYVRLAQVYRMKGDKEKYEQYLNKALQIDPQNELAQDAKSKKCAFNCLTVKE